MRAAQAESAAYGGLTGALYLGRLQQLSAGRPVRQQLACVRPDGGPSGAAIAARVKAGENRGIQLRHDFVARDWIGSVALSPAGDKAVLPRALVIPTGSVAGNLGVVAFVQTPRSEVLQALALPLCKATG